MQTVAYYFSSSQLSTVTKSSLKKRCILTSVFCFLHLSFEETKQLRWGFLGTSHLTEPVLTFSHLPLVAQKFWCWSRQPVRDKNSPSHGLLKRHEHFVFLSVILPDITRQRKADPDAGRQAQHSNTFPIFITINNFVILQKKATSPQKQLWCFIFHKARTWPGIPPCWGLKGVLHYRTQASWAE